MFRMALMSLVLLAQGASLADVARRERERLRESEAVKGELAREVLHLSGVERMIEQLSRGFSDSVDPQFAQFPSELREPLKNSARESFNAAKLLPILERGFANQIDSVSLLEVKRWYETPTGLRVLQADGSETFSDEHRRNLEQFAADLQKTPAPANRFRLIQDLEHQTQATERTVGVIALMMKSMISRMLAASSELQANKDAFVKAFEQGFTATAIPKMRTATIISYLYGYRSLSDDELREYVHFLSSTPGKAFMRATWAGLQNAMEQGGLETGRRYGEILQKK